MFSTRAFAVIIMMPWASSFSLRATTPSIGQNRADWSRRHAKKNVIWDCDGCLVDSEALLKQGEVDALISAGFVDVSIDDCNRLFSGYSPEAGAKNFETEYGRSLPKHFFRDQIANSIDLFRDRLLPLTSSTVLSLHGSGRKQVVASGSPRDRVDVCLEVAEIAHVFSEEDVEGHHRKVFTREDVPGRGKPEPDIFLLAAASMGAEPSQCVVVEDSTSGIRAALAANMEVVAFLGGGHAQESWYRQRVEALGVPLVYSEKELASYLKAR